MTDNLPQTDDWADPHDDDFDYSREDLVVYCRKLSTDVGTLKKGENVMKIKNTGRASRKAYMYSTVYVTDLRKCR